MDWQIFKEQKASVKIVYDQKEFWLAVEGEGGKLVLRTQPSSSWIIHQNQLILTNQKFGQSGYELRLHNTETQKQQNTIIKLLQAKNIELNQKLTSISQNQVSILNQLLDKKRHIQRLEQIIIKNNLKSNDLQKQHLRSVQLDIPEPVSYDSIQFYDGDRKITYTDCWEVSLLRFLHLVFGQHGKINKNNLMKFMDLGNQNCRKLIEYFKENNTYSKQSAFYTTKQGYEIRSKWCQFLNNSRLLKVKIDGKYQVMATISNLLSFFRGFFPQMKFNIQHLINFQNIKSGDIFKKYELILNQIYQQLSFNFRISVKINVNTSYDKEYLFFQSIQCISLDQVHVFDWMIYQSYKLEGEELKERLGGHSDLRFPEKS